MGRHVLKISISLVACLLLLLGASAQEEGIKLRVKIKHKGRAYPEATIKIDKGGELFDQSITDEQAVFVYVFPFNAVYHVHFSGKGMATKTLELDLLNTPAEEAGTLHDWELGELTLFKAYEGMDLSLLDQPVGRIHYDEKQYDFTIDYDYGAKREKELNRLAKVVEAEEKNEAVAERLSEKNYDEYLAKGNLQLKDERYDNALMFYHKAEQLFPDRKEVKLKIQLTDSLLSAEALYKDLILEADELYRKEEYVQARDKYSRASTMKPQESYPKSQMSLLSQKVKEQEMKNNQFNNFMAVADQAYAEGNFQVASANYKKALAVNPNAELATRKLAKSDNALAEKASAEDKNRAKFKLLMERIDEHIANQEFDLAQTKINQSEALQAGSPEIAQRKAALNQARKSYEAQKQLQAQQLAKEKEFESLKQNAQKADQEGNKKSAIYFYEKALEIHPEDKFVQSRIKTLKQGSAAAVASESTSSGDGVANDAAALDKMDKKSEGFTALLASKYPQGVTEVEYKEGSKEITKRIVVEGNRGVEYMKVRHSWGGTYYFKNGVSISENIWQKETK